jgi:hypothetical protein
LRNFAVVFERHRLEIQFARHGRTPANGVAC